MKRISSLVLALALLACGVRAENTTPEQGQPSLALSAQSAVLMEKETGTLLYEQQAHQVMEPASVTKIMRGHYQGRDGHRLSQRRGDGGLPGLFEGRGADAGGHPHQVRGGGLGQ